MNSNRGIIANPLGICILCGMQARGFVVQFNPTIHLRGAKTAAEIRAKQEANPQYACCSTGCQEIVLKIVISLRGTMPSETLTHMEQQAIKDARQGCYAALKAIGVPEDRINEIFGNSAQNMDYLIYTIWCGLRASMQRQSAAGEIPF